jgi:signal transduction histidine kinase
VGEGCQALFGVSSRLLQRYPEYFFELILPEDTDTFMRTMRTSAEELAAWDLEFRLRVAGSSDIKWVSLRASPRWPDDGGVLWEGIISDLTQAKLAELEIRRSNEMVREHSAHLQMVKEQERAHIAREIHDDLGGTLTAIKIELMRLGSALAPGHEQARERLKSAEELVDSALDTTRRISTDLRPGILDLGLVAAMEWQGAEFTKRMGIPCMVAFTQEHVSLADEVSIALFRIFQEALTNVAKHAHATRVEVLLEASDDFVTLVVHDNGRGFSESDLAKPRAFGLRGIHERAYNLGGEASVRSVDRGTEITVRVPRGLAAGAEESGEQQLDLQLPQTKAPAARVKRAAGAGKTSRKTEKT